jgi:hypothetical protein
VPLSKTDFFSSLGLPRNEEFTTDVVCTSSW